MHMTVDKQATALGEGEFAAVFLGKHQEIPSEFAQHPRVNWIYASNGTDAAGLVAQVSHETVKAILLTEGIQANPYNQIRDEAKRRRILYLHRRNPRALLETLYDLFPSSRSASAVDIAPDKGKIKALILRHPINLRASSADEARRLHAIAKEEGIVTTFGSLAQAVAVAKRKANAGEMPASIRKKDVKTDALQTLDDAIAGLQLMRDWIETTSRENVELRDALNSIRKLLTH